MSASVSADESESADESPATARTLGELLRRLARQRPDLEALVYPAFVHGGERLCLTAAALDAYVDDLARGLIALGVAAGERVAVWAANVPAWVPLEFALARIGAVLVTVNTALQKDEVAFVLRQSRAVTVLHSTGTRSNATSAILDELLAAGALPGVRHRIWLPREPGDALPEGVDPASGERGPLRSIEAVAERGRHEPAAPLAEREAAVEPGDVVNIQYTSGTTGFPKGVMLSHANILISGRAVTSVVHDGHTHDRVALIVPLFHCFGCVVAVLGAYGHGASLCCLPTFDPEHALRLIDEERCTVIHGVPTMYSAMLAHPDRARYDTTSLHSGLAAGAPCPLPLMRAIIDELHCPGISVAYGLTEASPGVSGSRPDDPLEVRCGTIGRPLPDVAVRLVDPASGDVVPDGAEGEIQVRGGNVMVGYNDDPEATARAVTPEGWLRTGDLGTRDASGNLRVVGRIKDIIIRGGENIAPAEIEAILREHPDIVDAAVVGVPDERFGEEVAAALILRRGAEVDGPAYTALLTGRVAAYKFPKLWRRLDAFPLTGSGKVQKFRLREMFAQA